MHKEISVIIPVYNAEKDLEECLSSLQKQTCQPKEIIVVDDGSTDHSAEIAEKMGATVVKNIKNMGDLLKENKDFKIYDNIIHSIKGKKVN